MATRADIAEQAGVTLIHEYEGIFYGGTPDRCRAIIMIVALPNLRVLFDLGSFVMNGTESHLDSFELLDEFPEYVYINDAAFTLEVDVRPAGDSDLQIPGVAPGVQRVEVMGVVSLEPL
jgi:hypothetical protein